MGADLAALLADPARASQVPVEAIASVLAAAAVERERIGALERSLLARLTGETVNGLRRATPTRVRSRGSWLRVAQVAEEYGIKPATVYDWIYKRRVTTKKLGAS